MGYFEELDWKAAHHRFKYGGKTKRAALSMICWLFKSLFKNMEDLYVDKLRVDLIDADLDYFEDDSALRVDPIPAIPLSYKEKKDYPLPAISISGGGEQKPKIAVWATGGFGDLLIVSACIKEIYEQFGKPIIDVFYHIPANSDFVFKNVLYVNKVYDRKLYQKMQGGYQIVLEMLQHIVPAKANIKSLAKEPKLANFMLALKKHNKKYFKFIASRPQFDGAFADIMVNNFGKNRFLAMSFDPYFKFSKDAKPFIYLDNKDLNIIKDNGLESKKFITVQHGWDNTSKSKNSATKAWFLDYWIEFVKKFKEKFPDIAIVQIGGANGEDIDGIDARLRAKTTYNQAAILIKNSLLHIDTEGGMVHLAHILGIKSVVLFGPTNKDYFAYENNINISAGTCSNCWWLTNDWLIKCPNGYRQAECMRAIKPDMVLKAVSEYISGL
ncbi:MAG: hypothetical protein LBV16_02945 [Elusimicrobiota bacterium]|jgi:ADP-heptose:LPS heptosyltransferase|nr:hypothetical protein [Elusimicrobiota bacterium]